MDFIHISFIDVVDILCLATVLYSIVKLTRGTSATSILLGILFVYLMWLAARALEMELMSAVLGNIIGVGVIALIVVFQPEIRRFLHMLGDRGKSGQNFFGRLFDIELEHSENSEAIIPLVEACRQMSQSKTGALIAVQRNTDLEPFINTGVAIDASVSSPMLMNIFFKNSPLHDGAVIISHGRIMAAKCMLPSSSSELPLNYGTRHRAAVGLSEESDAVVVVVSEETGSISFVSGGTIRGNLSTYELRSELLAALKRR
ncbi:TIGR00159 family protein [Bacteroidia bacterium]|nr:TIGR00159 family protein [Bacteroidia bacterium]